MSLEDENTEIRCGNCYEIVDGDGSMSSIRVCNNSGIATEDIEIIDAICYVYGISLEEIRTWTEQLRGANSDLNDVHWLKGNSIYLCDFCAYALSDNYKAHKKFEQLSNGTSFVCQINKFRRGDWESMPVPIIKAEVNMAVVDNQVDGDTESFCTPNADSEELDTVNDAQFSDSASEIKYNPTRNVDRKQSKRLLKKKAKLKKKRSLRNRQKSLKLEYLSDEDFAVSNLSAEKSEKSSDERILTVKTAGSFRRNVTKVKEKEHFECEVCSKKFERRGKLKEHKRTHTRRLQRENCKLCGKNLNSVQLARHIKVVHCDEEEKLKQKVPCQICGKLLGKERLKTHMQTQHIEVEKFKCEKCEKAFTTKRSCDEHMLTHSEGFIPFLCGQCGKKFNTKHNLGNHEKTHNDKEFSCELCSRRFSIKSSLTKHVKEFHVTEKKFVCEECGKSYKFRKHLIVHQRLHKEMAEKGENSVQCDECGKNFKHSLTLYNHKLRNHREDLKKVYQCDLCGKILSDATCLRTHKKLVHKMFLNEIVSRPNYNNSPGISQTQSESTIEVTLGLQ